MTGCVDRRGGRLLKVLGAAFGVAAVIGGTIEQCILRQPGPVAAAIPGARLIVAEPASSNRSVVASST